MRTKLLFVWMPIILLMGASWEDAFSQTTLVNIGAGTSYQYELPFNSSYRHSYNQMVYYSEEVGGAGYIGALKYHNASSKEGVLEEVRIWMGHVSDSMLTTSSWVSQDSLKEVFRDDELRVGRVDLEIPLDSEFYYDGERHLVIVVMHEESNVTQDIRFKYTRTDDNSCLYVRDNSGGSRLEYPDRNGVLSRNRPNITLTKSESGEFCNDIMEISVIGITDDAIEVEWHRGVNNKPFEVVIMDTMTVGTDMAMGVPVVVTDRSYRFEGLLANRVYKIGVRQQCSRDTYTEWCTMVLNTTEEGAGIPFSCDFESEEMRGKWMFDNGEMRNCWVIDTAARNGEGSMYGMYISNNELKRNEYTIKNAMGCVMASCLLEIDSAGEYNIGYDWRSNGQAWMDYARVMLVPVYYMEMLQSGEDVPKGVSPSGLPYRMIACDGGRELSLSMDWQRYRDVVYVPNRGNYYLVVLWFNNDMNGGNPPMAIDNIVLSSVSCEGVDSVVVDNITTTSVRVNGYSVSGNNFELCYKKWNAMRYDTVLITSPYVLSGLLPNTYYDGFLRTYCGEDNESYVTKEFEFGTACGSVDLPWAYGVENKIVDDGDEYPYCWANMNGNDDAYYWSTTESVDNVHLGERALYFKGSSSVNHDDWLFTPKLMFTGNDEMTMWVRTTSTSTGTAYHGRFALYVSDSLITEISDTSQYDRLTITGNLVEGNCVDFVGNTWQKVTLRLPSSLTGGHHLALAVNGFSSFNFCVDDIYVYPVKDCAMPDSMRVVALTDELVRLEWSGMATSYNVYYGEPGFDMEEAMMDATDTTMVELIGLNPNTEYEYRVVAICGEESSIPSYPNYFETGCPAIPNEQLPFEEDFSDNIANGEAPLDDCWYKGSNFKGGTLVIGGGQIYYPYVDEMGKITPNSLRFYSTPTVYSYAALPLFESEISRLVFSCNVRNDKNVSSILLGLMSNPNDVNTFTVYDTLSVEAAGVWMDYQIPLKDYNMADGAYIALLLPENILENVYVDNIKVEERGFCDSPTQIEVSGITESTAIVSWEDTVSSSWTVYYGEPGFDINTATSIVVSDTHSVELTELVAQTTYEVRVDAICDDNSHSVPSYAVQFMTPCPPITVLPYVEDFESYGMGDTATINSCWVKGMVGNGTVDYPYPDNTAAINDSNGLYFNAKNTSTIDYCSYVALPKFEENLNNLRIKFQMECFSKASGFFNKVNYSSKVAVGVMTDPHDILTFDTVAVFDMTGLATGTVELKEVHFDGYTGDGEYIALVATKVILSGFRVTAAENIFYVDDIEVSVLPSCTRPSDLVATMSISTADLTWSGESNSYEVIYSPYEDMHDSTVVVADTTQIQLVGLTSNTYYYVNVRALCEEGVKSEWMQEALLVRTLIDCGDGYRHIVDTIGDGISKNNTYAINANTGHHNTCNWMIFSAEELEEMGMVSSSNIIQSISLQTGNVGSEIPFRIYMKEVNMDQFNEQMNDTVPLNQMTLVYDDTMQFVANSWNEIALSTPFTYSDTMNLMIAFERNAELTSATYFYYSSDKIYRTVCRYNTPTQMSMNRPRYRTNMAFNVCGELPDCVRPMYVETTEVDNHSIGLSWTGTTNSYQIAYSTADFNPSHIISETVVTVNENIGLLQNLIANTTYYIYLRSLCGSDSSIWTPRPFVVHTHCDPFELPYIENFDSYMAGTEANDGQTLNSCWSKGTNNAIAYPFVDASQSSSSPNSLHFYGSTKPFFGSGNASYSYAALPMFVEPISELMVSFKLYKSNVNHGTVYVGLMTDPKDITTFQHIATVQPENVGVWESFEVGFANYTGSAQYIAFKVPDTVASHVHMDDVEVFEIPTCPSPVNVVVPDSTITTHSAIVHWTNRGGIPSNGYQLEYGPTGFDLGTGTRINSMTNPTTLSNLLVGTVYDVYVRCICGEEQGRWSFATTFRINCGPIALPVTYNFEYNQVGGDAPIPHCFHHYNDGTIQTYAQTPYVSDLNQQAFRGSKYLYFVMNNSTMYPINTSMIFPPIDTVNYPMRNNQMTFWGKSGEYSSEVLVGVIVNPENISTFTVLDTVHLDSEYRLFTIPFSSYIDTGLYPAIVTEQPNSMNVLYAYIDDVTLEVQPTCPRVYDLTTLGVSHTTATIGWNDTIGSVRWVVDYRADGETEMQSIDATTNPYVLTGLSPLTKYFFNVRPICASGDTSSYVSVDATFRTSQVPATVPYNYDFESTTEWDNWQTSSNNEVNWSYGTAVAHQGLHSMYISIDSGASRTTDWTKIVNAVAYRDINFGADTSSFMLTFDVNTGGVLEHNYDGVSILLVNPMNEVIPSNQYLTSPWGHVSRLAYETSRRDTSWTTYHAYFDQVAGVQRLVFYWYNQPVGNNSYIDKSGAVDNISIVEQSCRRPSNLYVTDIENHSATLHWSGEVSSYQVSYIDKTNAPDIVTTLEVQGTSVVLTSLMSNSDYEFSVRAICSSTDTSFNSNRGYFTTICDRYVAMDTLREDFTYVNGKKYNEHGILPDCWEGYTNSSNGILPHVVSSGSYWYAHGGKSLAMTAGNGVWGDESIVRLPYTVEPVNALTLSYWMCTESDIRGILEVGYLTGTNLSTDFVAIKSIQASANTKYQDNTGNQSEESGFWDTVSFASAPLTAQAVAFRWSDNNSYYTVCLDDIKLYASVRCEEPIIINTQSDFESITMSWSGEANRYQLMLKAENDSVWGDTILTTDMFYTFNNLLAETNYQIRLRALCDEVNSNSTWVETAISTTYVPCTPPTQLNVTNVGYSVATLNWNFDEHVSQWIVNIIANNENRFDTIETQPATLTDLYPNTEYSVSMKGVCRNTLHSLWSDTIVFRTLACESVSQVEISNIAANSATVTWTAPEGQTAWEVNYGEAGFGQGEGSLVSVTTTNFIMGGLNEETEYDVYVRAKCDDGIYSTWSTKKSFTTINIPVCNPVTNVVVSDITHLSATVSWTAGGEETAWELSYGPQGTTAAAGTKLNVTATTCPLANLTAETAYDVYVRAKCDEDFYSEWSIVTQFTTLPVPVCNPVTNVTVSDLAANSAKVSWTAPDGQTAWEVNYGTTGFAVGTGTIVSATTPNYIIAGLTAETNYDVYVRAVCGEDFYSDWSAVQQFTTLERPCVPVMGIAINNVTASSAAITWSDEEGQTAWELSYGPRGIAIDEGTKLRTTVAAYTLSGLQSDTEYDVYLRAQCDDKTSEWSSVQQFTTQSESQGIDGVEGNFQFAIYPNPTSGSTTISFNGVEGKVMISVVDMNGRTVANETIECGVDCEKRINVTHLSQGTYFVRVLGDNVNSVRKLIVR